MANGHLLDGGILFLHVLLSSNVFEFENYFSLLLLALFLLLYLALFLLLWLALFLVIDDFMLLYKAFTAFIYIIDLTRFAFNAL